MSRNVPCSRPGTISRRRRCRRYEPIDDSGRMAARFVRVSLWFSARRAVAHGSVTGRRRDGANVHGAFHQILRTGNGGTLRDERLPCRSRAQRVALRDEGRLLRGDGGHWTHRPRPSHSVRDRRPVAIAHHLVECSGRQHASRRTECQSRGSRRDHRLGSRGGSRRLSHLGGGRAGWNGLAPPSLAMGATDHDNDGGHASPPRY